MNKGVKAADISDVDFVRAVDAVQQAKHEKRPSPYRPWALFGWHGMDDEFNREYGPFLVDHFPNMPEKVLRAKAQRVIGRGLITGCACGCRGDMEITDAGLAFLADHAVAA